MKSFILLCLMAGTCAAGSLTGNWLAAMPNGDGSMQRTFLNLKQQDNRITGTVRWTPSIEYILDRIGCNLCLELGPGQVLAGLVSRIRKGTQTISIGDVPSLDAALPQLLKAL